jgi:predicted methyltransferase
MQMIKSIVFIDDDPIVNFINRRLIEVSLQDVNVMTFEDAREAHKYLLSYGGLISTCRKQTDGNFWNY